MSSTAVAVGVPLTLAATVGLLLNCYIIVVVILTRQIATANNMLLLHLGLVDTLLGVLFLVFSAPSTLEGTGGGGGGAGQAGGAVGGSAAVRWFATGAPCTLHGFLFTLLHPVALWTVCGLNCDRYYAISAPLHYAALVSTRKVAIGLGFAWLVCLLLCVPPLFTVAPFRYSSYLGACAPDFTTDEGAFWYSAVYTAVALLVPTALIVGCNIKVLMIARYHRHRIASAIYEVTLSAQVTITHQRNPFFVPTVTAPSAGGPKFRGRSAIPTVLQILGSFFLLYFPFYTTVIWNSAASTIAQGMPKIHPHVSMISTILLTCSPPINGLLYGVKSKTLRKTFQNYWRKKMTKSEVNHEIQARTPSTCGSRRPSLTPLGLLTRPILQRRLSEALLDMRAENLQKNNMKRIASELSWRPDSSTCLQLSFPDRRAIPHTSSCNTLQVPNRDADDVAGLVDEDIYKMSLKALKANSKDGRPKSNTLLSKVFGLDGIEIPNSTPVKRPCSILTAQETTPVGKSPKILITRAFSEESDKTPSTCGSPARATAVMNRKHSISTTTLLERKWRNLRPRFTEDESDSDCAIRKNRRAPTVCDRSSDSSTASDASSGRMYMSLDDRISFCQQDGTDSEGTTNAEEPLLQSWPPARTQNRTRHSPPKTLLIRQKTLMENNVVSELAL